MYLGRALEELQLPITLTYARGRQLGIFQLCPCLQLDSWISAISAMPCDAMRRGRSTVIHVCRIQLRLVSLATAIWVQRDKSGTVNNTNLGYAFAYCRIPGILLFWCLARVQSRGDPIVHYHTPTTTEML